jgi:hypothetical protein
VFYLAALGGASAEEIASFYGITRQRVSVIKFRMLQKLRRAAREFTEEWDEREISPSLPDA